MYPRGGRTRTCTTCTISALAIAPNAVASKGPDQATSGPEAARRRDCLASSWTHLGGETRRCSYATARRRAMSRPRAAACSGARSPASSLSRRTSRPTVGGRNGPLLAASQRSSLARVVLRGAAPFRKLRNPFGETPTSRAARRNRSEEHTSELQSPCNLVCRLLLEKKKKKRNTPNI